MQTDRISRRAFTIIELLVVVSLVVLLVALMLPALGRSRNAARELNSASSVRQMLTGYRLYQLDSVGRVMLGYPPAQVDGVTIKAHTSSGHELGFPIASRYPWRLVPYVQDIWEVIHTHVPPPPEPQVGDSSVDAGLKAYTLSLNPTYGLNSVFIGGHGAGATRGFVTVNGVVRPNDHTHVVFRAGDVRRPSGLIVFGDAQMRVANYVSANSGFFQLTPPRAAGLQWLATDVDKFTHYSEQLAGVPKGRYSDKAVIGFFDGHVFMHSPEELSDMRFWANNANDADYDIPN